MPNLTICQWCQQKIKEGDTHGEAGLDPRNDTVQRILCRVVMDVKHPRLIAQITSEDSGVEPTI